MIADFYNTFEETPDKGSDIPQEVLDVLAQGLPSTFMYYRNDDGEYIAGPRPEHISEAMLLTVDIPQEFIEKHLKNIPPDKWAEYAYRMQLPIPVKSAKIGDKDKQIPIENTVGNPLESPAEIYDTYMYPEPFPPAKPLEFETAEGDKITIHIARKPYDSFREALFSNVDFPALQMQFILGEDPATSRIKYKITPKKANTVTEALEAIHLFQGLSDGTAVIDGKRMAEPMIGTGDYDAEQLKHVREFWTTAKKLEDKLGVTFSPGAEFPAEDVEFFAHLNYCLLEDKEIAWEHPFDHFHMKGIAVENGKFEDLFGKEGIEYKFLEGPIQATLLGAEFELYSETRLSNMVMTNIVWDDDKKTSGEVYVSDPIGSKWKLYRKYRTKEQI